ncbi:hypothetical protein C8F01DRAFT_108687 [Mycena amicta]|nr:hypothetical protein C8F01DRAFT_108687 [Mycena amicta]
MGKRKIHAPHDDDDDHTIPPQPRPQKKKTTTIHESDNDDAPVASSSRSKRARSRKLKTKAELRDIAAVKGTQRKKNKGAATSSEKGKQRELDEEEEMDVDEADVIPEDTDINAARRLERSMQYDPAAELLKLPAVGRAQASRVGADWSAHFQELARAELARRQAANKTYGSDLDCIQAIVAAYCSSHGHIPILNTSAAWNGLPASALAAIARSPTDIDVQELVSCKVLVVSGETGEEGEQDDEAEGEILDDGEEFMRYYIRIITVNGDEGQQAIISYLAASPENTPHAVMQLLLTGTQPQDVVGLCRNAISSLGLEAALDVFAKDALHGQLTQDLVALAPLTGPSSLVYLGLTTKVPGKRAANDLDVGASVRFVNFCKASPHLTVTTYHIPDLDIPLTTQYEQRTDPLISERERILCALAGEVALNSASGGFLPIHQPSAQLQSLRDLVLQSLSNDRPLGVERKPEIEQAALALLEDEYQALPKWQTSQISKDYFDYVKQCGLGTMRFNKGRLVRLNIMKDPTEEALRGDVPGYFDAAVGSGPREDRSVRQHLNAQIPDHGDLDAPTIARYVGPFIDFWRLVLLHLLYWLHVLWLLRFLHLLQPIIVHTQSNILGKLFASGLLAESDLAPPEFFNGRTSPGLLQIRPQMTPPRFTEDEFSEYTGTIHLVPYGPGAKLTLHVAGAHYGSLKYEPQLASTRWLVLFLVALVVEVLSRVVSLHLDGVDPEFDWEDEVRVRGLLMDIKEDADRRLEVAGVKAALEGAKAQAREREFVVNFLRCLARSRATHEYWTSQPVPRGDLGPRPRAKVFKVKPSGDQRHAQLEELEEHAERLVSYGLWPDPHHLESYGRRIGSKEFRLWFLALADGTDAVYSANAEGKTAEAAENSRRTREDIALHRVTEQVKESDEPKRLRHFENAVDAAADMTECEFDTWETSSRYGVCSKCGKMLAADSNHIQHDCVDGEAKLDLKTCPTLERFLYPHDGEEFFSLLGPSSLQRLKLTSFTVREIFAMEGQLEALEKALPNSNDSTAILNGSQTYPDAIVYARHPLDSPLRLLMMAVDVILRSQAGAATPAMAPDFEPRGSMRTAWSKKNRGKFNTWLTKRKPSLFFGYCRGPLHDATPWTFCVTNARAAGRGTRRAGKLNAVGIKCVHCNQVSCEPCEVVEAESILHMPYHFSRMTWFTRCLQLGWLNL